MFSTVNRMLLAALLSFGGSACETSPPPHPEGASPPGPSAAAQAPGPSASVAGAADAPSASASTTGEPAVIPEDHVFVRIMRMNGGNRMPAPGTKPRPFRQVIVAIRGDGKAVWSEDDKGDGPWHTGTVDRERLDAWVTGVRAAGTLVDPAMKSHVGPDATSIELDIDFGDQRLKIVSWHEMVDPTKTIALSRGIVALDGKTPAEHLAEEPPEFRRFLDGWAKLRKDIRALLPKSGTPVPEGTAPEDVLTQP